MAIGIGGRDRHGIGIVRLGLLRLVHPGMEQRERVVPFGYPAVVHNAANIAHGSGLAPKFCRRKRAMYSTETSTGILMLKRYFRPICICFCATFATACASSAADDPAVTKQIFDSGVVAYDAKNYEEAFKIFSSIDDRDVAAMRNVALMLRKGEGTGKDPKAAEEMYKRAAQGGLATAAADLGEMLLNGEAGRPDAKAALPWLLGA